MLTSTTTCGVVWVVLGFAIGVCDLQAVACCWCWVWLMLSCVSGVLGGQTRELWLWCILACPCFFPGGPCVRAALSVACPFCGAGHQHLRTTTPPHAPAPPSYVTSITRPPPPPPAGNSRSRGTGPARHRWRPPDRHPHTNPTCTPQRPRTPQTTATAPTPPLPRTAHTATANRPPARTQPKTTKQQHVTRHREGPLHHTTAHRQTPRPNSGPTHNTANRRPQSASHHPDQQPRTGPSPTTPTLPGIAPPQDSPRTQQHRPTNTRRPVAPPLPDNRRATEADSRTPHPAPQPHDLNPTPITNAELGLPPSGPANTTHASHQDHWWQVSRDTAERARDHQRAPLTPPYSAPQGRNHTCLKIRYKIFVVGSYYPHDGSLNPQVADPSHEWRGTAPRALSQDW